MSLAVEVRHPIGAFSLDVAFRVDAPGVTALFGASGAGKSSTADAIAGLLRPQRGRIEIAGEQLVDTARGLFVPAERRRIGYVFQDARLFPHLSVRSNLLYGAKRAPRRVGAPGLDEVVAMLGVAHLLARRPAGLSGGERQRVALGRALLSDPRVLLLDEPLAALDGARKAEILPYLERLRDEAGLPMLYVSHSIDEVSRLADHMVVLDQGRVVAAGSVFEIMSRLDLFPITGRFEAGAVLEARIAAHDARDDLSVLDFDGGQLLVARLPRAVGERVRVRIRARDVLVALAPPPSISAANVLACVVTAVRDDPGPFADVQLACGATRLLARITNRSRRELGVEPGASVYAVVKTVSVERRGLARAVRR